MGRTPISGLSRNMRGHLEIGMRNGFVLRKVSSSKANRIIKVTRVSGLTMLAPMVSVLSVMTRLILTLVPTHTGDLVMCGLVLSPVLESQSSVGLRQRDQLPFLIILRSVGSSSSAAIKFLWN